MQSIKNQIKKLEDSEIFQRGKRKYHEGKTLKSKGVPVVWAKKKISTKDWNNFYSQSIGYCFLEKDSKGVWIGFLTANEVPFGAYLIERESELLQIQRCFEIQNIYPRPYAK